VSASGPSAKIARVTGTLANGGVVRKDAQRPDLRDAKKLGRKDAMEPAQRDVKKLGRKDVKGLVRKDAVVLARSGAVRQGRKDAVTHDPRGVAHRHATGARVVDQAHKLAAHKIVAHKLAAHSGGDRWPAPPGDLDLLAWERADLAGGAAPAASVRRRWRGNRVGLAVGLARHPDLAVPAMGRGRSEDRTRWTSGSTN
jgi:hypothetical protein